MSGKFGINDILTKKIISYISVSNTACRDPQEKDSLLPSQVYSLAWESQGSE